MAIATLSSKGQITIPKDVREDLGLETGSQVMFVKLPGGKYQLFPRTNDVESLIGLLHVPGSPVLTLEEMDEAIADGAAASGMRGTGTV